MDRQAIRPRDFMETEKGLFFAAIAGDIAFLRYYPHPQGDRMRRGVAYRKVASTMESFQYLRENAPEHLHLRGGRLLQRCPPETIRQVYSPAQRLMELEAEAAGDPLAMKALGLSRLLEDVPEERKGVTGSLLVDMHRDSSDIDFVVYGVRQFHRAREALMESGLAGNLTEEQWQRYYEKRFPGERALSHEDFLWHEKRKGNIGVYKGTIYNLLLVDDAVKLRPSTPVGPVKLMCTVTDASMAFHVPSIYLVDHDLVDEVLSYTHTYAGQAMEGEVIEVSGVLEKKDRGWRVVVGTTREAVGEYIRVVRPELDPPSGQRESPAQSKGM
ncbi:MAG: DNA polymerase subunit beta [Methanobacteriota archaeon]|nr:MAG: DNA polymerase subunit beta [Euryarchaeota archaeon]